MYQTYTVNRLINELKSYKKNILVFAVGRNELYKIEQSADEKEIYLFFNQNKSIDK